MQSIAAAPGAEIDQRQGEIVAAEEPFESVACGRFPPRIAIRPPSREACGDCRRGFHGLLIERARMLPIFAETCGTDRPEVTCRRGLLRHQPAQGPQTGI